MNFCSCIKILFYIAVTDNTQNDAIFSQFLLTSPSEATRRLLVTDLSQETRLTPQLALSSPKFRIKRTGRLLVSTDLMNINPSTWWVSNSSDRGWLCHEFEPSTTKDMSCRAAMHAKSVES
ncbi:hypothetical protein TNCV_1510931 [Trichonephila clavipes]|nr:hypothetical protein TNCV_1510931 [Trichonephila clavipes]